MTERPFLADPREAQGLHVGSITKILRVMEPQPVIRRGRVHLWRQDYDCPDLGEPVGEFCVRAKRHSPLGVAGDRLWLAEVWGVASRPCPNLGWYDGIEYANEQAALEEHDILPCHHVEIPDDVDLDELKGQWNSAASMPKWASSLILDVADVRVVRLDQVTGDDMVAAGLIKTSHYGAPAFGLPGWVMDDYLNVASCVFRRLVTDDIKANPWLWLATVAKTEEVAG